MKLYLVAGEASGDSRGAELMRALRIRLPNAKFLGAGGPLMRSLADGNFLDWADEAVLGLWDVLKKYGYFKRQFDLMLAEICRDRPDALILIDYPGFNLRLAKAVRAALPDQKIIYYVSPQVWAWNQGRIPKMARILDLMLCIFPFEEKLYSASGLKTVFVGHPILDSLAPKRTGEPRDPQLIGLFPGSRSKEVRKLFPVMLTAAKELRERNPNLRFEAAAASPPLAQMMKTMVRDIAGDERLCLVNEHAFYPLMQRAAAGMVCSGTATLEAAYFGLPMVILYKVAWLTWIVAKRVVKVPYIGMPNILAGREIAQEFLQDGAEPHAIAEAVYHLATNESARRQAEQELAAVVAQLGQPGAGERAAEAICAALERLPT